MIKHVVMWEFKPEVNTGEFVKKIQNIFNGFKNDVPGMTSLEVYEGFEGFSACLISEHENKKSLDLYQNHPEHLKVKSLIAEAKINRANCDFIAE